MRDYMLTLNIEISRGCIFFANRRKDVDAQKKIAPISYIM